MAELRFDVFGTRIAVERRGETWLCHVLGAEGKRRPADFQIPDFIADEELEQYLFDLFHEAATPTSGDVRRLPPKPPRDV